jgi:hypothetical protein
MNEREIQVDLMWHFLNRKHHVAAVPNSTMLLYDEADLLTVTKAGLVHEFEIKISMADYNREFKNKERKHLRLQNKGASWLRKRNMPNYFWFVTYGIEIEPPSYAGWIIVGEDVPKWQRISVKKNAPRLHSDKWIDSDVARIARLLSFRLLKEYENNA